MRRSVTLLLIVLVSYMVAFFISPADPTSHYVYTLVLALVAIPCYIVGVREDRSEIRCVDSGGTREE